MASRRTRNGTPAQLDRARRFPAPKNVAVQTVASPSQPAPAPQVEKIDAVETPIQVARVLKADPRPALALFCFEEAESVIGQSIVQLAQALTRQSVRVHIFSRTPFPKLDEVARHVVEVRSEIGLIEQAQEFAHQAFNAFLREFPPGTRGAALGHEWTSTFVLSMVQSIRNLPTVLAIQSLERQRSDMSGSLSVNIDQIELDALRQPHQLLIRDPGTAALAKELVPECAARIAVVPPLFTPNPPAADFDPGVVKARYQIGPIDPTILYVGDLSDTYGADILMKALPGVFKNHNQARAIFVGDGDLYWTLRVYSRYLLLDHAVRMPGSVEGQEMLELIQAADVVVVPSRESTPWWPILAAWAAGRPLVVSHNATPKLVEHEQDGVLVYPTENSVVWGIERVLFDPELRESMAAAGLKKLEQRFGWNAQAEHVLEIAGLKVAQPSA
jgi:glycosyltransferase involved in cell wall biosynthesis